MINHSNRQPIGNYLIVFLDTIPNFKTDKGDWKYKESDILITGNNDTRKEIAYRETSGILLALGAKCFSDLPEGDRPKIGDRLTFTSYSGLHKTEGDFIYRSLKDSEVHDWYIPQRKEVLTKKFKTKNK